MKFISRRISKLILALFILSGCADKNNKAEEHLDMRLPANYFRSLKNDREQNDVFFMGAQSPLSDSMKLNFTGVNYYDTDTNYRVAAIFERIANGEIFEMPSSGSIADQYQTMGKLHFMLNNTECELDVFQNISIGDQGKTFYFIPFYDETSGNETYGGGRYLDIPVITGSKTMIDFNRAYQPYCYYNHTYSCPIPPLKNRLNVAVKAGEKM